MKTMPLTLLVAVCATPLLAQDQRAADAHVHGTSTLTVAVEGNEVALALESPGMDIVGFEYAASTEADKAAVTAAIALLMQTDDIITLPAAAGCSVVSATADLATDDHDDHADEHDDHDGDHAEDHDGDHADDHDDHGADDAGHDDHAAAVEDGHAEFAAAYTFACDDAAALTTIAFPFFDSFPNANEMSVQYVTDAGAGTAQVTRDAPVLQLDGQ